MPESMTAAVASPPVSTNTGPVQVQEGKDTFYAWEHFFRLTMIFSHNHNR